MKTYTNKRNFINIISSMSDTEINDYIKNNGKGPKPVTMCIIVKDEKPINEGEGA